MYLILVAFGYPHLFLVFALNRVESLLAHYGILDRCVVGRTLAKARVAHPIGVSFDGYPGGRTEERGREV